MQNYNNLNGVISINELQRLFINHSKARVEPSTLFYYERQFRALNAFFSDYNILYSNQINEDLINTFIDYSKVKWNNSINTVKKRVEILKMACTYAYKRDYILKNPFDKIDAIKTRETLINTIGKETISKIFNYLETLPETNKNLKMKCLLYLLVNTGARINELNCIKLENIDFDNNSILLTKTKTHKPRYIFFCEKTKKALHHYISNVKPCEYLFVSLIDGTHHDIRPYYKYFKQIRKDLSIKENISISPHKWRHTYATNLIENGAPLIQVQTLLGHTDVRTTRKYIHLNNEKLRLDSIKYNSLLEQ